MLVAARMLRRRSVVVIALLGVFLGAMLLASKRLIAMCPNGGYCSELTRLQEGLPSFRFQTDTAYGILNRLSKDKPSGPAHRKPASECTNFPDTSNMLLIMKTGASESFSKIPTQVLTNLKCLPEYFIFSDMEQNVAGHYVRDSLDTVLQTVKTGNKDFDLYHRQQKCPTYKEACNKQFDAASESWSLDKYKNVHIAEKTYKMRPNYDWYVFVDADTYVVWPTLVEWMKQLNPSDRHYLGSVTYVSDFPFGHGGSGYIVSKAAMRDFFDGKEGVANRWDQRASQECCGDYIFGLALKSETNVAVNNTWPTINGEKPSTLWFGDGQWCHPLATMHHIGSEEISMFEEFEKERQFSSPMLIKDVYHRFVEPHLNEQKQDWDNLSDDTLYMDATMQGMVEDSDLEKVKKEMLSDYETKAHLSVEDCRTACQHIDDCLQWRFHNGICGTSRSIKHGSPTKPSESKDERRTSGWNVERINAWVNQHDDCGQVKWPEVGPEKEQG